MAKLNATRTLWNRFRRAILKDPGQLTILVTTFLGVMVAFEVPLDQEQRSSIIAMVGAVAVIVASKRTPNSRVAARKEPKQEHPTAGEASEVPTGQSVDVVPLDGSQH